MRATAIAAALVMGMVCPSAAIATGETPDADTTNYTNNDIGSYDAPELGCMTRTWGTCWEGQQGTTWVARVVVDDAEPLNHDGSLRLSTPGRNDTIALDFAFPRDDGPSFASWKTGGFSLRLRGGAAPAYTVGVNCTDGWLDLTYAGAPPESGPGWLALDLVQGGQAQWSSRWSPRDDSAPTSTGPQPLSTYQSGCPDGEIRTIGLKVAPGANMRVDALTFDARVLNFRVPTLTRSTYEKYEPLTTRSIQRQDAAALGRRSFGHIVRSAPDYDPIRVGLPRPRAVVIAPQRSWQAAMLAAPLASAARGPLLLNTRGDSRGLDSATSPALYNLRPTSRTVYLVGNTRQLPRTVADAVRRMGLRVVRVGAPDRYTLSVKVARLVDRLRGIHSHPRVFLTSGTSYASGLSAPAAASSTRGSVLLTRGSRLPAVVRHYLTGLDHPTVYTVGRAAGVARPATSPSHRFHGRDRYDTATLIAKRFFAEPDAVTLVPADSPFHAAMSGAYAGRWNAPVLPVPTNRVPAALRDYLVAHRSSTHDSLLLGSTAQVPAGLFAELEQQLTPPR